MTEIGYLPIWKKDATAEERLLELAIMAKVHPERFAKFIIIYQERPEDSGKQIERYCPHNVDTTEIFGLIELGKLSVIDNVRG
jgi:hypothetical protein